MKAFKIWGILAVMCIAKATAQSVGIGTNNPKPSAKLDVQSTTQGITLPSMTSAQRKAINNPAKGLLVFDTDKSCFYFFDGQGWKAVNSTSSRDVAPTFYDNAASTANTNIIAWSVAMDKDFFLLGVHDKDSNNLVDAGVVYIFKKLAGNQWSVYQTLAAPALQANTHFGISCAIEGNYMVVGGTEKIYTYQYNGSRWVFESALTMPQGSQQGARFGSSVAISHIGAAVYAFAGSPWYNTLSSNQAGRIDIFQRNAVNGAWSAAANYLGNQPYLNLGYVMAAEGSTLIAGAPGFDSFYNNRNYINTGVVYTYRFNGSNWLRGANLSISPDTNRYLGYRVAFKDSVAAISGSNDQTETNSSNSIFLYRLSKTGLLENAGTLSTIGQMESSRCGGYSLAVSKDYVLALIPANIYYGISCGSNNPRKLVVFKSTGGFYQYYRQRTINSFNVVMSGMDYAAPGTEFITEQNTGIFFGNLEE